jgi:hypothetical protein
LDTIASTLTYQGWKENVETAETIHLFKLGVIMRGIPCDAYEGWLSASGCNEAKARSNMHDDKHNHGPRTIVPLSCDKTTIMAESSKCGVKAALTKNIQEDHDEEENVCVICMERKRTHALR